MAKQHRKTPPPSGPRGARGGAVVVSGGRGAATLGGEARATVVAGPAGPAAGEAVPATGLAARVGGRRLDLILTLGFVVVALFLYFWRIEAPYNGNSPYIYDEVYHAYTAAQWVKGNTDPWIWTTRAPDEGRAYEWTHPPLGKEIIALGIIAFGDNPFGWRFTSAIFGAAGIGLIYWLGLALTRRRIAAFLFALLTLCDGLYFVESRGGLLDIYGAVFMVGAMIAFFAYLAAPADRVHWPLLGLGLGLGLGIATKWNAVYGAAVIGAIVMLRVLYLAIMAFTTARRAPYWPFAAVGGVAIVAASYLFRGDSIPLRVAVPVVIALLFAGLSYVLRNGNLHTIASDEERDGYRRGFVQHLIWVPLFLAVLPAAIYMASYIPFFKAGFTFQQFRDLQWQMYYYHSHLKDPHPYGSKWWQWPLTQRPVWYGVDYRYGEGIIGNTYANGNPLLYWSFFGAIPYVMVLWWQREKWPQLLVLLVGFFGQWLPWALIPRVAYAYHFLPAAIFGTLAVAVMLDDFWQLGERSVPKRVPAWPFAALGILAIALGNGLTWGVADGTRIAVSVALALAAIGAGVLIWRTVQPAPRWRFSDWQYLTIVCAAVIVAGFVFFYPIYSSWPLTIAQFNARLWISTWK